jgi:hypothetical protein
LPLGVLAGLMSRVTDEMRQHSVARVLACNRATKLKPR